MTHKTIELKREYNKKYREEHKERIKLLSRNWQQKHKNEEREKKKKFREENREIMRKRYKNHYNNYKDNHREIQKRYNQKDKEKYIKRYKEVNKKRKDKIILSIKNWKINNPEKRKAQSIAKNIPKEDKCIICGYQQGLLNHHWRYDKPLMVSTVCASCHKIIHFKQKYKYEEGQFIPISYIREKEVNLLCQK